MEVECEEAGFGFRRWEERSSEERGNRLGKTVRSGRFQGRMVIADRREEVNSAAGGGERGRKGEEKRGEWGE